MKRFATILLACALLSQPALAAITFDSASAPLALADNGGSGNYSHSYTGATLTNGLMVMCVAGGTGSDSSPAATYNGVSMTLNASAKVLTTGSRWVYQFYLLAPASGSHTLAITQTGGDYLIPVLAEYAGVKQSAQPDAVANNVAVDPNTTSVTVVNANSWLVECGQALNGMATACASTNATYRTWDGNYGTICLVDSNGGLSAGSHSMTISAGNPGGIYDGAVVESFQPDTGGGGSTIVPQLGLTGVGH